MMLKKAIKRGPHLCKNGIINNITFKKNYIYRYIYIYNMYSFDFVELGKNVLKKAVASSAVVATGLSDQIKLSNKPQNEALKQGAVLAVAEKAVDYYDGKDLNLYDVYQWTDDIFYNAVGYYALNKYGIPARVGALINDISPLDSINDSILTGLMMTGLQLEKDMIQNSPVLANTPLIYLTNISRLIR
jgi:hypothetical protein